MSIQFTHLRNLIVSFLILGLTGTLFVDSISALVRGYRTNDTELVPGMVVALSGEVSDTEESLVERASLDNDNRIIGIATTPDSDLVAVVSGMDQVYVQTSGEVSAYVSDLNGSPAAGELLALSPLRGILMKADEENTTPIVGVALEDFSDDNAETRTIDENGTSGEVRLTKIRTNMDSRGAAGAHAPVSESSLQRLGRSITGRTIPEIRVLAAMIIFILVLVAEGGIIYGAITSTITALGRNPLARKIIMREVAKVVAVAIGVLFIGILAVYGVLWL